MDLWTCCLPHWQSNFFWDNKLSVIIRGLWWRISILLIIGGLKANSFIHTFCNPILSYHQFKMIFLTAMDYGVGPCYWSWVWRCVLVSNLTIISIIEIILVLSQKKRSSNEWWAFKKTGLDQLSLFRSTIGAEELNFCVRNGNRWAPLLKPP